MTNPLNKMSATVLAMSLRLQRDWILKIVQLQVITFLSSDKFCWPLAPEQKPSLCLSNHGSYDYKHVPLLPEACDLLSHYSEISI